MSDYESRYWEGHAAGRAENINERLFAEQQIASLNIIKTRMGYLTLIWSLLIVLLFVLITLLVNNNIHLRDELAKPVRLTYAEKMKIVQDYLADGETKFALRQQIGCTDKE